MKKVASEFMEFLKEYKIVGLAIAFVMSMAATALVKSIIENLVMPIVTAAIPGGAWRTAVLVIGSVRLGWGPLLAELINFIAIAFVVFIIAKIILREEKVSKK